MKKYFYFTLVFVLVFAVSMLSAGQWYGTLEESGAHYSDSAGVILDPWGSFPKAIHGNDGGLWLQQVGIDFDMYEANKTYLSDTPSTVGNNRSIMKPLGDGTWAIQLPYGAGYTIPEIEIIYSHVSTGDTYNTANWHGYDGAYRYSISNVIIPEDAGNDSTFAMNWYDTPNVVAEINALPDSGRVILSWKLSSNANNNSMTDHDRTGDVDSADTDNPQYGYKLYRSHNNIAGPYVEANASNDTFITAKTYGMTDGDAWKLRYIDQPTPALTNGDSYYYVVIAHDAYGLKSDTNAEFSVKPRDRVNIWFRVEGADPNVIEKNDGIVYLTPYVEGKPYYFNKIKAKVVSVVPQEKI